jgi:hypothetical protein
LAVETYKDAPPQNQYNVDEITLNPSTQRNWVLIGKEVAKQLMQCFVITLEGNNGKMNKHVSLADILQ